MRMIRRDLLKVMAVLFFIAGSLIACAAAESTWTCVVRKGEYVWIRSGPSKDADQIGTIRYGYEMPVSEIQNGFAHVQINGTDGWVDVFYLEQHINEMIYTVCSDGPLNKRETPEGRFMGKIKSGVRISVLGWRYSHSGELWAKVYKGGYVKAQYLAEVDL